MEVPEYCVVGNCNEEGEKAHLITRANLPLSEWNNPKYYIILCRKHHSEQHSLGVESFCDKYALQKALALARDS